MPEFLDQIDAAPAEPKTRKCLRCGDSFKSGWAGERVCTHCKNSKGWREGVPARVHPNDGRTGRRGSSD